MGTTDNPEEPKLVAYALQRPDSGGAKMILGTTPKEIGELIANEIEFNQGLPADECDKMIITAYETTQSEIDALPEFEGW